MLNLIGHSLAQSLQTYNSCRIAGLPVNLWDTGMSVQLVLLSVLWHRARSHD